MKRYFRVYWKLVIANISTFFAYTPHLVSSSIASFVWSSFTFISITLLTSKTPVLFDWKREELIILTSVYAIFYGIFHVIFAKNFEEMATIIHFGKLDTYFLKPIDAQFLLTLSKFHPTAAIRIVMGFGFLLYFMPTIGLSISWNSFFLFLFFLCVSVLVLYSIWFLALLILFWNSQLSNLVDVLLTVSGMGRYPSDMYKVLGDTLWCIILPLTLTTVVPAKILFHTVTFGEIALLLITAVILFFGSRLCWKRAIRSYTSVNS